MNTTSLLPTPYAPVQWEILYEEYNGTPFFPVTQAVIRFKLALGLNQLDSLEITFSREGLRVLGLEKFPLDALFELRRAQGTFVKTFSFFARKFRRDSETLTVLCYGPNYLLKGRHIPYYAGTRYTTKNAPLDDIMKEVVRENMTSEAVDRDTLASEVDRDLAQVLTFTVAGDTSEARTVTASFTADNVFDTLQALAGMARQYGEYLFFALERTGLNRFEFRTYNGFYGEDKRDLLTLSERQGTLTEVEYTEDYTDEVNVFYVYGAGESTQRAIVEVSDSFRVNASALNRRESTRDARNTADADLEAVGYQELAERRPRRTLTGRLSNVEGARYGLDWDLGFVVNAEESGELFDVMITGLEIGFNQREEISGFFEVLDNA